MKGKTIKLYLVEGTPKGVLTAEISNWTGKLVVCPRWQLEKLAGRDEATRTGVYALVGPDPDITHRERVYIGESENIFERLKQHHKDAKKEFWTRCVLVTSKDENLTKSHGLYLESQLIQRAKTADRAIVDNTQAKEDRKLPESDRADMEQFLDHLALALPVLGFNFIQEPPRDSELAALTGKDVSPKFLMTRRGVNATAQEIDGEFIVRRGSTAKAEEKEWFTSYRTLRRELIEEGKIAPSSTDPTVLVFTDDVIFNSPSAAAAVVYGGNANGRTEWKVEGTGQSYGGWQEQKVDQAAAGVD